MDTTTTTTTTTVVDLHARTVDELTAAQAEEATAAVSLFAATVGRVSKRQVKRLAERYTIQWDGHYQTLGTACVALSASRSTGRFAGEYLAIVPDRSLIVCTYDGESGPRAYSEVTTTAEEAAADGWDLAAAANTLVEKIERDQSRATSELAQARSTTRALRAALDLLT